MLHSILYCAQSSLHQMSVPIPGTGPYSVSYRLPVSIIFKAPCETAESTIQSQNTLNFQVQNLTWRLERASCRAKSNTGNHNMNHLPKYKHVGSLKIPSSMVCRCLQRIGRHDTGLCHKPCLLERQLWAGWGIQTANKVSDIYIYAAKSYLQ